jgi:hypothetical protein
VGWKAASACHVGLSIAGYGWAQQAWVQVVHWEVLEGDAEGEADGGGGAVVEDVLRSCFVFGEGWIVAAEGGRVEGVVWIGAAFVGVGCDVVEEAIGVVCDLGFGGLDFVEDC